MNKTTKYVLPNLNLDGSLSGFLKQLDVALLGAYVGYNDEEVSNSVYLLYDASNKELDKDIFTIFIDSSYCKRHIPVGDLAKDNLVLVEIENEIDKLNTHFIEGKYSMMYTRDQAFSLFGYDARKVLTKNPAYREILEQKLGTNIDPDAELDSQPNLKDEIYYDEHSRSNDTNDRESVQQSS